MQFFRGIFHNQNTCHTSLSLCIERVYIYTVYGRFKINLVSDGIPAQGTFGFIQLTGLIQYLFHQEIGHIQTAHAVTVVVDISPATAVGHTLVGNMIVHSEELLLQLILYSDIRRIVISNGYALHQFEVFIHFHAQFGKHILIPIRYHTFVSFRLTYHEDRQTAHLTVSICNLVEVVLLTNSRHFLIRQLAGCIKHISEAFLYHPHFLFLHITYRSQGYIRFP